MCKIIPRIKQLAQHEGITIGALERVIGASKGVLSRAISNGTDIQSKWLQAIVENYPQYSAQWLLTGGGDMMSTHSNGIPSHLVETDPTTGKNYIPHTAPIEVPPSQGVSDKERLLENRATPLHSKSQGIPLVSVKAVGGFAGKDFLISESDIEAYYVIPKFRNLNVDFMIEVVGDSMMPRLFPGDIIACSIVRNYRIIQWNKTYLIATEDLGMIVKRLKKSSEKDSLLAVSDNSEYDPFDIPLSDITGLARVVGVIHAE